MNTAQSLHYGSDDAETRPVELPNLIDGRLLEPEFQPVVSLVDRAIRGAEALIRGPRGGHLHAPSQLFAAALAEDRLGELDEAGRAAIDTAARSCTVPPALLFINVEPTWLDESTGKTLLTLLSSSVPFTYVIEITERALVAKPALVLRLAAEVRRLGHFISLDDVGTDLRALALLAALEPEIIKLDRHIIRDPTGTAAIRVVPAVIAYASRTGSVVLAEGIESETDLSTAVELGASWGQGWLFGRPTPLSERWPSHIAGVDRKESARSSDLGDQVVGSHSSAAEEVVAVDSPESWMPVARSTRLADLLAADSDSGSSSWVGAGADWLLPSDHGPRGSRRSAIEATARLILPLAFVMLAFPNFPSAAVRSVVDRGSGLQFVVPAVLAGVLAALGVRLSANELDVHDRGLDRIIGVPLLAVGTWLYLTGRRNSLGAAITTREVIAAVAFLAGSGALLWGTRMFLRLRWAIMALLLAVPTLPHRDLVDAVVTVGVIAVGARDMYARMRDWRQTDEAGKIVAALNPSGTQHVRYFPPALATVVVLSALALGLAATQIVGQSESSSATVSAQTLTRPRIASSSLTKGTVRRAARPRVATQDTSR